MKVKRINSQTGNASWAVGYLLRKDETGLIFTTEIMQDPAFRDEIAAMLQAQKTELYSGKKRMSWDLIDKRKAIISNAEAAEFYGKPEVQNLESLIHAMDATMQYSREGKHFRWLMEPIKLPDTPDPNAAEKIIKAVEAVRDMFPKNLPALFTLHTGGEKRGRSLTIQEALEIHWNSNPDEKSDIHLQACIAARIFENGKWGPLYKPLSPKDNEQHLYDELCEKVEQTVIGVVGTAFKKHFTRVTDSNGVTHKVAIDPNRPIRTLRSQAGADIIRAHPGDMLLRLPLESIENRKTREEIRQVQEQVKYDRKLLIPEEEPEKSAFARLAELQLEGTIEIQELYYQEDWSTPAWHREVADVTEMQQKADRILERSAVKAQRTEGRIQAKEEKLKKARTDFMDLEDFTEHRDKERALKAQREDEQLRRRDEIATAEQIREAARKAEIRNRQERVIKKFIR